MLYNYFERHTHTVFPNVCQTYLFYIFIHYSLMVIVPYCASKTCANTPLQTSTFTVSTFSCTAVNMNHSLFYAIITLFK